MLLKLTSAGKRLGDRVIGEHLDNECRLPAGLNRAEQRELAVLLRKLLLMLERDAEAGLDRRVER